MPFAVGQIVTVLPTLYVAKSEPTRPPSDFYAVSEVTPKSSIPTCDEQLLTRASDVRGYDYHPALTKRRRTIVTSNKSRYPRLDRDTQWCQKPRKTYEGAPQIPNVRLTYAGI
jgi:hypothetical protein